MRAERGRVLRISAIVVASLVLAFVVLGVQQFQNFLTLGAIYALVALGYTMVYGIIELINFAHGDVFMVGAFVSMWIMTGPLGLADQPIEDPLRLAGVLVLVAVPTMIFMGLVGVIIERFAYRPLRHAPLLAPLITAIGVSFILQNIIQAFFSSSPISVPQIFPRDKVSLLGGRIGVLKIFMI